MKKFTSVVLAGTLALSLSAPALAANEGIMLISARLPAITVNGTALDLSKLPQADGIPLRALAEADFGFADWYAEENKSFFSVGEDRIYVDTTTCAIELNDVTVADMKASFFEGVTFVPSELLTKLAGYTVEKKDGNVTIVTSNGAPLVKAGRNILEAVNLSSIGRNPESQLAGFFGINPENYTEVAAFLPMINIKASGLFIGKVADGKLDDAKTELEEYRARLQQTFEQYLVDQLEIAKNGKVITSGDYVMLVISEDNDTAIEQFNTAVKDLK